MSENTLISPSASGCRRPIKWQKLCSESFDKTSISSTAVFAKGFATQITLRQALAKHVTLSVITVQNASKEHKVACCSWIMNDLQSLNVDSFAGITTQVCDLWAILIAMST